MKIEYQTNIGRTYIYVKKQCQENKEDSEENRLPWTRAVSSSVDTNFSYLTKVLDKEDSVLKKCTKQVICVTFRLVQYL
jgi:hypothetical protein